MKNISLITLISLISMSANSWEVDNFTNREQYFSISDKDKINNLYILNDETNRLINKAVDHVNKKFSCKEDLKTESPEIYYQVKNFLSGNLMQGALENFASKNKELKTVKPDSTLYLNMNTVDISLNLNGHVVGVDKLSGFFDDGNSLFEIGYLGIGEEDGYSKTKGALSTAHVLEDSVGGYSAFGVKSYADIAAAHDGMKFYANMLNGKNSYLKCDPKTDKYVVQRVFDWADFVNDSWDEGVNCSMFYKSSYPYSKWKNQREADKIENAEDTKNKISLQGKSFNRKLYHLKKSCPDEVKKCRELAQKNCAVYTVSPDCLKKASNINQTCNHISAKDIEIPSKKSGYSFSPDAGRSRTKSHLNQ